MITRKILTSLFAMGLALATNAAQAIPLLDLFEGADITVGDKLFNNWGWAPDTEPQPDDPEINIDLSKIEVTGNAADALNPGLHFEANDQLTTINEDGFLDFNFVFDVTVLNPDFLINGSSLEITDYSLDGEGGIITVLETVFDGGDAEIGDMETFVDNLGGAMLFDAAVFGPQASISVEKNILIASDFEGEIAGLVSFEQHFSQTRSAVEVPEPSTLFLMGMGLAAIGVARRRKA